MITCCSPAIIAPFTASIHRQVTEDFSDKVISRSFIPSPAQTLIMPSSEPRIGDQVKIDSIAAFSIHETVNITSDWTFT